jgi:hypothetical protein
MVTPSPSAQLESLRPDIKDALMEFNLQMNLDRMIGLQVMPVLEVQEQGGTFPVVKREALLKVVDTARASGGGYKFAEYDFEDDNFATKENGIVVPIDRRNAAIYSNFEMEVHAGVFARSIVMTNHELRVAAKLFDTVTFTPTAAGHAWNSDSGEPIADVEGGMQRLYDKGVVGNAVVVGWKTFRNLRNNPSIIERITADGAGQPAKPEDVTTKMLAQVFGVEKFLVGGAQYNSAKEGQPAVLAPVWSNSYAAVCRLFSSGGPITQGGFGRTMHWGGDGSSIDGTIETWYDKDIRGDKLRYRLETQEKVIFDDTVELISGVTT